MSEQGLLGDGWHSMAFVAVLRFLIACLFLLRGVLGVMKYCAIIAYVPTLSYLQWQRPPLYFFHLPPPVFLGGGGVLRSGSDTSPSLAHWSFCERRVVWHDGKEVTARLVYFN